MGWDTPEALRRACGMGRVPPSPEQQHNANITLYLLVGCTVVFAALSYYVHTLLAERPYHRKLTHGLISAGVAVQRVVRTTREIERKLFHVAGLLVPLVYWLLTYGLGWHKHDCVRLCVAITTTGFAYDAVRAYCPALGLNRPVMRLLREKELDRISGAPYFALGCTLAICIAKTPAVAAASLLYLNFGDLAASLVGIAYGGGTIRLGRDGKKSLEGSVAMFVTCYTLGYLAFWDVHLAEYVAFSSALAATYVAACRHVHPSKYTPRLLL